MRAIEAFVLVAESLSFTKAAGELNITKSAISRRIQSLEEDLEVQLFIRGNKALMLTPDGETYYKLTGPAFGSLRAAGAQLKRTRQTNTLCVALPQSFASYWLLPRVSSFYEQYPNTELRLDSLGYFNLLDSEAIDVVLQVAKEPPPGFHAERLLSLELFPVCSPTLQAVIRRCSTRLPTTGCCISIRCRRSGRNGCSLSGARTCSKAAGTATTRSRWHSTQQSTDLG
ncbi:LysR family transcriptional regulator [Polymorphobacter megasporae]|nr:LysR family transcriptional regulator [Polymorphobacter megasporae]UAJ09752.1 LysR family transcriptional regulator [Polymorphobacter megasporae]